jgi:hypothetical protein
MTRQAIYNAVKAEISGDGRAAVWEVQNEAMLKFANTKIMVPLPPPSLPISH